MEYLLDTDIASFAIRGVYGLDMTVIERRIGQVSISWPTETELLVWAYISAAPSKRFSTLRAFLMDVPIIPLSSEIQHQYATLQVALRKQGQPTSEFDLLIASTAIVYNRVLVTHNTSHFESIPGLRIQDWAK